VAAVSGCGGGSKGGTAAEATLPSLTAPAPAPTVTSSEPSVSEKQTSTATASESDPSAPAVSRTIAYKRAYADLPYHSGPLNVAQTLTSGRPGPLVDARVSERGFLCKKSPAQRRAAVASYYALVLGRVRAQGQSELRVRVSRLVLTGFIKDVYAIAKNGRVRLTAEGAGGCPR